ncbi:eukaryotic translation initiation factor 2 subunit 2-like [Saccostrea cucullata]|uniref:eukaryotic translation initiation factor 2 subunit 2-like n=1 Tax=Saccostrea cuccullata TaxID=36930 RepID=UPI002ED1EB5A
MAEDELTPFDPTNMKKKKKKKKVPFELDGGMEENETPSPAPVEEAPEVQTEEKPADKTDDDFSLDFGLKKKKKKKKAFDVSELEYILSVVENICTKNNVRNIALNVTTTKSHITYYIS